jgi:hypothetical protein
VFVAKSKLYTNPSLISKPLFQPPPSPGLLWYKVYIYSKSIPHKIGTNLANKNTFPFFPLRDIGCRFYQIGGRKKAEWKRLENQLKIGHQQVQFEPRFCTSRNSIMSHFYNTKKGHIRFKSRMSCSSSWFVKYPSTDFVVILLWITFEREQITWLLYLGT